MSEEKKGRPEDYDEDEWAWDKFGPSAPGNNFDALSCAQHYYDRGYLQALGDVREKMAREYYNRVSCADISVILSELKSRAGGEE